jgi:hypothetical protein
LCLLEYRSTAFINALLSASVAENPDPERESSTKLSIDSNASELECLSAQALKGYNKTHRKNDDIVYLQD